MPAKNIFSHVTLMLLGPKRKLRLRHAVKTRLVKKGYLQKNIIIMEDIEDDEKYFNDKFGSIIDNYTPNLFFALFNKNEKMEGVIFELGWICGKYKRQGVKDSLRIISELEYNWMENTMYVQALFHTAQLLPIEKMNTKLISKCIHNNVINSLNKNHKLS